MNSLMMKRAGFSPARLQRLADRMRELTGSGALPGIAVAVSRRGKTVFFEGFGSADFESHREVREDTLFRIYSITKTFTCVALMSLWEEGRVRLDDPVSAYLPEFGEVRVHSGSPDGKAAAERGTSEEQPTRHITIRDLLVHTSGIAYPFNIEDPGIKSRYMQAEILRPDRSLAEMVNILAELPLLFHPGTGYLYSHSTDVAGRIVELVSGRELDRCFEERILGPLRMRDTGFYASPARMDHLAALYVPAAHGPPILVDRPSESMYCSRPNLLIPGSGLMSTLGDCLKLARAFLAKGALDGKRILARRTVGYMSLNHVPVSLLPANGFGQGFGVLVCTDPVQGIPMASRGAFCKGGAGGSLIWVDPREELCFVLMSQLISPQLVSHFPYLFSEELPPEGGFCDPSVDLISTVHTLIYQALE